MPSGEIRRSTRQKSTFFNMRISACEIVETSSLSGTIGDWFSSFAMNMAHSVLECGDKAIVCKLADRNESKRGSWYQKGIPERNVPSFSTPKLYSASGNGGDGCPIHATHRTMGYWRWIGEI